MYLNRVYNLKFLRKVCILILYVRARIIFLRSRTYERRTVGIIYIYDIYHIYIRSTKYFINLSYLIVRIILTPIINIIMTLYIMQYYKIQKS